MPTIALYKNTAYYPDYNPTITLVKTYTDVTPRNVDIKSGYVDVQMSFDEVMGCNYLKIEKGSKTLYAWINNIEERSGDALYRISYSIDPLRTYKDNLVLDNQYIARQPGSTDLYDPLLGSSSVAPTITRTEYVLGNSDQRVMVVQHYVSDNALSISNVPMIASPYRFYVCTFNPKRPLDTAAVYDLIRQIGGAAKPSNIVTMYSVPYFYIDGLPDAVGGLPVVQGGTTTFIGGWKYIPEDTFGYNIPNRLMTFTAINHDNTGKVSRRKHALKLVFPDAGIMNVPDDYRFISGIGVRQDVDLFSGASNYILASNGGAVPYDVSLRGSAVNSIPIIADPEDTYLSQNQNSLITSMLGDVATAAAVGFGFGGPAGAIGGAVGRGLLSAGQAVGNLMDIGNKQVNPPAFLGSALVASFNQKFWALDIDWPTTNDALVHSEYGYPLNMVAPLVFPASGFVQTRECNIKSDGTVPLWAIQEINALFDAGIKVL